MGVVDETGIAERYRLLTEMGVLDERGRRLWADCGGSFAGSWWDRGGRARYGCWGVDGAAGA